MKPPRVPRQNKPRSGWPLTVGLGLSMTMRPVWAGDLLRGGSAAPVQQTDAATAAALAVQQQLKATQQDALAKTTRSLEALRSFQAQARALATQNNAGMNPNAPAGTLPDVPNGLGTGALKLRSSPSGALTPVQSQSGTTTNVTIKQTSQQAFLEWETFNVGRDTHLQFDQSAGGSAVSQWITFNHVTDPTGRPSQILGQISAPGQVYIINQNGIIFGGASQVNARSLVASSLPLNSNLVKRGLLNNPDSQFLLSTLPVSAGLKGTPAFTPPDSMLPDNRRGDITVQAGARLSSPVSADGNGGRIMLAGPNITNAGSLLAPSGQVSLAAGLQVGLDAHKSSDASLRGLDVYVGSTGNAGTVTNSGIIEVPRGNVSISGRKVEQLGGIESSTSVSLNGRIDIAANYDAVPNTAYDPNIPSTGNPFLFRSSGEVNLGEGSLLRILPEYDSTTLVPGSELALRSQVNLQGQTIHLGSNTTILAPNAFASLKAGTWAYNAAVNPPLSAFIASGGQVYFDTGATMNVAGSAAINAPISRVVVSIVLRSGELAPSPLQRDGFLRGRRVTVDLRDSGTYEGREWVGTPLAELRGYPSLVERTVGELTVGGGSVDISAGSSVIMQPGSGVNVSGGYINYTGAPVQTTKLWVGGNLVDIRDATPDRLYNGILSGTFDDDHDRWGVRNSYTQAISPDGGRIESTTPQGGDAGRIAISAPAMALDGLLTGIVAPGPRQLRSSATSSAMPRAGQLALSFTGEEILNNSVVQTYPSPPDITFDSTTQEPAGPFELDADGKPSVLTEDRRRRVFLSPQLTTARGFGSLTLHNEGGNITVPETVTLTGKPGSAFRFHGSNISISGNVTAPGGTLLFEALNLTPYDVTVIKGLPEAERLLPAPNAGRGIFTLGPNASLSAAGWLVDDRFSGQVPYTRPARFAGGSVTIKGYTADLAGGSRIDVSGSALIEPGGTVHYGNGGSITINGGVDPQLDGVAGGSLRLGAMLSGLSGVKGGSLAVQAPLVQIGGGTPRSDTLLLAPECFNTGGFTQFTLTGLGARTVDGGTLPAVSIAPGAVIRPEMKTLLIEPLAGDGGVATRTLDLPIGVRAPVSVNLIALGIRDGILDTPLVRGDITTGTGSVIEVDPRASVTLSAKTITAQGSIVAPGGSISLNASTKSLEAFPGTDQALTTLYAGPESMFSTAGTTVLQPDAYGRRIGSVLAGGDITLHGNVFAAAGARLDVSGATDEIDVAPSVARPLQTYTGTDNSGTTTGLDSLAVERVRVDTNAGTINLHGGEFLVSDAFLRGQAGGATAAGGTLQVSSGRFYPPGTVSIPPTDSNLVVKQGGSFIPDGAGGTTGQPVPGIIGHGYFTADTFSAGGFDSLKLGGVVEFQGAVNLNARGSLRVSDSGVLSSNSTVNLTAPYVSLGMAFASPVRPEDRINPLGATFAPTYGSGELTVSAGHIDLGTLSLQNTGRATFTANQGDIRGSGVFNMAGHLTLRSGQIYPVTASPLEFFAYDYNNGSAQQGSITVEAGGTRQLPLSAGGALSLFASRIEQNGTLRTPFGSITLGWDGSGTAPRNLIAGNTVTAPVTGQLLLGSGSFTSVSGVDPLTEKGLTIPYGISPDGLTWIDPRGVDITAGGLPEKSITLNAANVGTAAGAMLDLRGGGDLFAYRWVEGNGGPEDILASSGGFAILPGYQSNIAPVAPYNSTKAATNLIAAYGPGYVNTTLHAGDQIFVQGSRTLAAGNYTLLPARYALLPGGVLVTPRTQTATGTWELPDGSSLVSGYEFNSLNTGRTVPSLASQFELASGTVIRERAQYDTQLANPFLTAAAIRLNLAAPLLPGDSGALAFQTTQSLNLMGTVLSPSVIGGRGARIDISSALDFIINRTGETTAPGTIALSSATLQSWGTESLVIGGRRSTNAAGSTVLSATSNRITVDNAGAPLSASDLTLAARGGITLADGAQLASTAGTTQAEDYDIPGNGALIRVAADPGAAITRRGVTNSTVFLTVGADAQLSGGSITLDSAAATTLDATASLAAQNYTVNSGRISLVLDEPGTLTADHGLVLTGPVLAGLQNGSGLSLSSYSSLDLYGHGTIGGSSLARLALNTGEIRGLTSGGSNVTFAAQQIQIGNAAGAVSTTGAPAAVTGSLAFRGNTIRLTDGNVAVNQTGTVILTAPGGVIGEGAGRFTTQSALEVQSPLLTGGAGSNRSVTAGGSLILTSTGGTASVTPGLGATLQLSGTQTTLNTSVLLPSGSLSATSTAGTLNVNNALNTGGTARSMYDVTRYTDAGTISLSSIGGDVRLGTAAHLNLSAASGGGNAGTLLVTAPGGAFVSGGTIDASGASGGSFTLDTSTLPDTAALSSTLARAGLTRSQSIRVRNGNVILSGSATAHSFSLSADAGSVTVTGAINAAGATGGNIHVAAHGGLTVAGGALLTVGGQNFDNAGKGGHITLEAGTQRDGVAGTGVLDLQSGATLDLSVAANTAGSAALGQFTGKLHLRTPQTAAGTDLLARAINSTIVDASSIVIEGYRVYDLTGSGAITSTVQTLIKNDGIAFLGTAGTTTSGYTAMMDRLLANNPALASAFVLAPGAEILNRSGSLTLGTTGTTTLNDWDLSAFRYGDKSSAGVLTLRAAGDLVFYNTLSDGFTPFIPANNPPPASQQLWQGRLTVQNPRLPVNAQSYSYRLTAGADLTASSFASTTGSSGSLQLGKAGSTQSEQTNTVSGGNNADIRSVIPQRWQVIRTGSGDITINTAGSTQLLNQLATIYTAGTAVADVTMGGTFDQPRPGQPQTNPGLGAAQLTTLYPAQYSLGGGNVSLTAGGNIEHLSRNADGALVEDSQLQLPNNWLYRRGTVDRTNDNTNGQFATGRANGEVLSTSWWVDFNNFYQGIGALGGGNIALTAAGSISNVDAVAPTNLRVTKGTAANPLAANQTALELGGGDVTVRTGGNLNAGIYYVERGSGILNAGGSILTNPTRSVLSPGSIAAGQGSGFTELPTTLFAGRASFDIAARGNVLLGPVANPFLLPQGLGNSVWYKSFLSTFGAQTSVTVSSLGGGVTLRTQARPFGEGAAVSDPLLSLWAINKQFLGPNSASLAKPWLRLNDLAAENNRLRTLYTLQPGSLAVSSYTGSINIAGGFTLSPSATGNLSLLAATAINALQPTGTVNFNGLRTTWGTSTINLSDADPLSVSGVLNPLGYTNAQAQAVTVRQPDFFLGLDAIFAETGSSSGVLQTKQALHAAGLLHLNDTQPLRLYAGTGDISGLTLFSPKSARIFAGRDLTDASLYIQHVAAGDLSIITSGRDIVPASASAPLRVEANRTGNALHTDSGPLAGDIQISGPGTLQVLAGHTLDLGTVSGNADGTGVGLTSIGNARNPYLAFDGANLIAGAGIGSSTGLGNSTLDFDTFISSYIQTPKGTDYLKELAPQMNGLTFDQLSADEQKRIALEVFYLVLRDTGRQHLKTPADEYATGFAAIAKLFPSAAAGDIFTRSRDIRTRNGGNLSLFAPGGALTLASTTIGNPLAPPGIVTESGGNISIFTRDDVSVGIGRIFTLRGGNEILWSSKGDIAAGNSARTVKSAPPTRVLIDPQSGAVQTDLAGLATGGGIGVLATVAGVISGDVDLIAPEGIVDAGDAGIRSTGNLTIAATQVVNAGNISVGGTSSGTPAPVAAPSVSGLTSAGNSAAAGNAAAGSVAQNTSQTGPSEIHEMPSIFTVEVLGYGGGEEGQQDEDEEERRKREREAATPAR